MFCMMTPDTDETTDAYVGTMHYLRQAMLMWQVCMWHSADLAKVIQQVLMRPMLR